MTSADDMASEDAAQPDPEQLARAFARCFSTPDGETVMAYLRAVTVGRALGPEASDAALRHVEGQRWLVRFIARQTARGRTG
ncbi:MAG: Bbp19 family protein [Rhodospirillales bacterium]